MEKRPASESPSPTKKLRVEEFVQDRNFKRPPVPKFNPKHDSLQFQQFEIEHYNGPAMRGMPGPKVGPVPILRIYGVTMDGHSVLCHAHGFQPYCYVTLPDAFTEKDVPLFKEKLNAILQQEAPGHVNEKVSQSVQNIEIVEKLNLQGYIGDTKRKFARISVTLPRLVPATTRLLKAHVVMEKFKGHDFQAFESNIDFDIRFMIDTNVRGCCWIEIPAGKWSIRPNIDWQKTSQCHIECDVAYDAFIAHDPEGEWSKVAPFYFLSFDIECAGRPGVFPEPDKDPVIQIASVVQRHGDTEPIFCNVFTLNTCAPIAYAQVRSFEQESELLTAWADFVRELNPDILTGYNINNFDLPYLLDRAKHLKLKSFPFFGRLKDVQTIVKEKTLQSKAMGKRFYKYINTEGRLSYDMLIVVKRNRKLRSYTLNNVSQELLGQQKEDVHYTQITGLQNGDEQTRHRLAVYCIKDAHLPLRILNHLNCFSNDIELARVAGVTINTLMTRGEQIKVVTQILTYAQKHGYLMPTHQGQGSDEQFEGATVIEPLRGYYKEPIATLDFSSLYPSIMMAHNLCYTTLLDPINKDKLGLNEEDITKTPHNHYFVKSTVRKGLLPQILENLLSARKKARKQLAEETDKVKKAVLNGRQLALKVSANAVYGFTGAQVGKLPCLEISGSVTSYGRSMIERTRQEVETHYTQANGYEHNAVVIYGDTDSVMVKFGVEDLNRAMELGREAAEFVSSKFIQPIKLEFEKVYYPYLLINKKRYAGLYFTKPDKYDKMDCKGIETVRRDNCPLVANTINVCLQKLLINRDPNGAVEYAKQIISDLLCNRVDISQLVVSKELSKTDYAAKQAHVELAKKLKIRDPGTAPKLGDRVPYVIVSATKGTPAYAKAEDPIYALENSISLDAKYYLENQLSKPLVRIFQPVLGDKAESMLLHGDHTRTKIVATSKVGALFAFTQKKETCLGCKTVLTNGYETRAVCHHCEVKQAEIYLTELTLQREREEKYARLWTECQRCQGSLHEEVLCTSRDCPIFYMRKKVQIELGTNTQRLKRFGDCSW